MAAHKYPQLRAAPRAKNALYAQHCIHSDGVAHAVRRAGAEAGRGALKPARVVLHVLVQHPRHHALGPKHKAIGLCHEPAGRAQLAHGQLRPRGPLLQPLLQAVKDNGAAAKPRHLGANGSGRGLHARATPCIRGLFHDCRRSGRGATLGAALFVLFLSAAERVARGARRWRPAGGGTAERRAPRARAPLK